MSGDACSVKTVMFEVQKNGIIRDFEGLYIGRIDPNIDWEDLLDVSQKQVNSSSKLEGMFKAEMSINKWYEITCDWCGCAQHFTHSIKETIEFAKENGWVIKGKKHFDTEDCYESWKKKVANELR